VLVLLLWCFTAFLNKKNPNRVTVQNVWIQNSWISTVTWAHASACLHTQFVCWSKRLCAVQCVNFLCVFPRCTFTHLCWMSDGDSLFTFPNSTCRWLQCGLSSQQAPFPTSYKITFPFNSSYFTVVFFLFITVCNCIFSVIRTRL